MLAARVASLRRAPAVARLALARPYSEGSFQKKEKAHEDQYIRDHEALQLKKLREAIAAKKEELAKLEKEHAETASQKK